jgi:hypothetical protein
MGMFDFVVKFFGDVRVHRMAMMVAAVAVAVSGAITGNGTEFGLDEPTMTAVGSALFMVAAVAREIADPVILKPFLDLFKR